MIRGPKNARAVLHAVSHRNGQSVITWAVGDQNTSERTKLDTANFYPWPRRNPMSDTEPLLYLCWNQLMSKVEIILAENLDPWKTDTDPVEKIRERAKYEARGQAELLATLMKPFMDDADQVVKAAVKKYKEPDYEVPGLGEHLWNPMLNPDGTPRTPVATPKTKTKTAITAPKSKPKVDNKSTRKLSADEAEGIKSAVDSGMFSKEDVASMFKVSIATVEAALSS